MMSKILSDGRSLTKKKRRLAYYIVVAKTCSVETSRGRSVSFDEGQTNDMCHTSNVPYQSKIPNYVVPRPHYAEKYLLCRIGGPRHWVSMSLFVGATSTTLWMETIIQHHKTPGGCRCRAATCVVDLAPSQVLSGNVDDMGYGNVNSLRR